MTDPIIIPRGSALHERLKVILSTWEAALIAEPSLEEPEDNELLELIGTEEPAE